MDIPIESRESVESEDKSSASPVSSDNVSGELDDTIFDDISVASFESGDEGSFERPDERPDGDALASVGYSYERLDHTASQIRILTISSADRKEADIHCTLEIVSLGPDAEHRPIYEALSYTWGTMQANHVIHVNGCPFSITSNLDIALRYLRKPLTSRVLWIDAICIDQDNLQEKNDQVKRMRDVFNSASQVLVWLGETDKDARTAMAFLERVDCSIESVPAFENSKVEPFLPALDKFFKKPWWTRIWVVQEVCVANKPPLVGCGRKWVSWKAVEAAIRRLNETKGLLASQGEYLNNLIPLLVFMELVTWFSAGQGIQRGFEMLLYSTSGRDATILHDKIYALLGLIEDDNNISTSLVPDYSEPCTVAYQSVMIHILESSRNLGYLVQAMNKRNPDVPSWCADFSRPNWNQYTTNEKWLLLSAGSLERYTGASGNLSKPSIVYNQKQSTLEVPGSIVGRIEHFHASKCSSLGLMNNDCSIDLRPVYAGTKDQNEKVMLKCLEHIYEDATIFSIIARLALEKRLGATEALRTLADGEIWRTMNGNFNFEEYTHKLAESQKQALPNTFAFLDVVAQRQTGAYESWGEAWSGLNPTLQGLADSGELHAWAINTFILIGLELIQKTLFSTDTGYIGRAPTAVNAIQEDDLLCILHACPIPAILRPKGNAYEVVTFAWVSGIMNGEYFDGVERDSRSFLLC